MDLKGCVTKTDGTRTIVDREKFNEYYRRYRKQRKWLDYHRDHNRKWRKLHGRHKEVVRNKVHAALRAGTLFKRPCWCASIHVEAHHKDYRSPLKVTWLCRAHHRQADILEGRRAF